MDPYKVLKIKKTATDAQVKSAYRRASKKVHPDRGGSAEAFHEVNLANRVLSDPERRKKYDETGEVDGGGPDNATRDVLRVLGNAFGAALQELLNHGKKVEENDLIAEMKKYLNILNAAVSEEMRLLVDAEKTLKDVLARLTEDASIHLVELTVQGQLNQASQRLAELRVAKALHDRALEHLKVCSFRFTPKKQDTSVSNWMRVAGSATTGGIFFKMG